MKDKHKLYALHAPEVECIGKDKARCPYEFGVKVSVAVTHKQGLMVGARSFPGMPWDSHTLTEQIEQSTILLEDIAVKPKQVVVGLGYRGKDVDAANPGRRQLSWPPGNLELVARIDAGEVMRRNAITLEWSAPAQIAL